MGWLFTLWGAIPIRRGEADMKALNQSLTVLKQGAILGISPEGTRNKTGVLLRARPGIITLALHSNAPLIPIAHWGGENFRDNLKRLRRTDFHIRVGRIFTLESHNEKVTKVVRQQMVDEIMYQLAGLMPEEYRGAYRNQNAATTRYIHFA
jgi:1-acyl-sn-glycerol-3-phosphate acyltransferase